MKFLQIVLLLSVLLVHNLPAQVNNTTAKKIDSLFTKYNAHTPGVAVAIVQNGKIVFKKGYGMANLEYDIPNSPQTIFHVASLSKQFTSFAIYLLEKEGKISLNDDIRKYIPELPVYEKPITIQQLCSHTSGLKDQWALLTLAGWRMDDVITTEQILKLLYRQQALNFEPGTKFKYSNSGYTLLAEIVKRITGKSFAAFTKEKIFDPLNMHNTQFYEDNNIIVKNRAYSYGIANGKLIKRNLNYSTAGPSSLFTTAEDLSKWTLNFEKPVVGDEALIKRFNEIAKLNNNEPAVLAVVDDETIYHLQGQFKRNYKGLDVFNHTGSDAGFKSYMGRFPGSNLSIILLSNDENFASYKAGMDIAAFYLADKFKKNEQINPETTTVVEKPATIENKNLHEFEGTFENEALSSAFVIKLMNGRLTMTHSRLSDAVLTESAKDKFTGVIGFSCQVNFIRNALQEITGLSITNFGASDVIFRKIK